jgi:LDH2 family malate/lactate/ureidoglycolate dehydrogenase
MQSNNYYTYQELAVFAEAVFLKMGCSPTDARLATKVLLAADLRGIDSHGIARLVGYVRLWEVGRINATPNITIVHETPSTAVIDGDRGLGLIVAPKAMEIAKEKAKQVGTGWVSVKNSNHFGIAGYHAMMALDQEMIGMAMTNASALVAPTYAAEKLLGTNPIAVAIPAGQEAPFVADFATTTAANGKLEIAQRNNTDIPLGWAQDAAGNATQDASILKKGGALLPLGSEKEQGSHKGYALGSIVDIFSAVLSGASFGPWAPPFPAYVPMPENMPGEGLGHFIGAMRIDAFRPAADFKSNMDLWLNRFRNATPAHGHEKVYVAGDIERAMESTRMQKGIPLVEAVQKDLADLATKMSLTFEVKS